MWTVPGYARTRRPVSLIRVGALDDVFPEIPRILVAQVIAVERALVVRLLEKRLVLRYDAIVSEERGHLQEFGVSFATMRGMQRGRTIYTESLHS